VTTDELNGNILGADLAPIDWRQHVIGLLLICTATIRKI